MTIAKRAEEPEGGRRPTPAAAAAPEARPPTSLLQPHRPSLRGTAAGRGRGRL